MSTLRIDNHELYGYASGQLLSWSRL